jgi:N-methylhydantoinase B
LYPLLVLWRREEIDSGGAGRQRGGVSASIAMTPLGTSIPAAVMLSSSGMATAQNAGLAGGAPGNMTRNVIVRETDALRQLQQQTLPTDLEGFGGVLENAQCLANSALAPGEVLYLHCQGGGGYGDPLRRPAERVAIDVTERRVSDRAARQLYGVAVGSDGAMDEAGTRALREQLLTQRRATSSYEFKQTKQLSAADLTALDDNLAVHRDAAGEQVCCRHCSCLLGSTAEGLRLASRNSPSRDAGPSVVSDPAMFIDEPIVFREYFCPSCWTRLHCNIVPQSHVDVVSGFRLVSSEAV